jgi:hypothetical protein
MGTVEAVPVTLEGVSESFLGRRLERFDINGEGAAVTVHCSVVSR